MDALSCDCVVTGRCCICGRKPTLVREHRGGHRLCWQCNTNLNFTRPLGGDISFETLREQELEDGD